MFFFRFVEHLSNIIFCGLTAQFYEGARKRTYVFVHPWVVETEEVIEAVLKVMKAAVAEARAKVAEAGAAAEMHAEEDVTETMDERRKRSIGKFRAVGEGVLPAFSGSL